MICACFKCYQRDEMVGHVASVGENKNGTNTILVARLKERDHLEDLDIDGRIIIIKCTLIYFNIILYSLQLINGLFSHVNGYLLGTLCCFTNYSHSETITQVSKCYHDVLPFFSVVEWQNCFQVFSSSVEVYVLKMSSDESIFKFIIGKKLEVVVDDSEKNSVHDCQDRAVLQGCSLSSMLEHTLKVYPFMYSLHKIYGPILMLMYFETFHSLIQTYF